MKLKKLIENLSILAIQGHGEKTVMMEGCECFGNVVRTEIYTSAREENKGEEMILLVRDECR